VPRLRVTALIALLAALALPAGAAADGDPASDTLLGSDVYLPFFPTPSKPEAQTLTRLIKEVKAKGYPMKVALIQTRGDLGAYPNLFNQPQRYADLLEKEIEFAVKNPHLLTVMPGGFGGENLGPKVDQALSGINIDVGAKSDGLARAAIEAVAKIATANGHPTPVPKVAESKAASGKGGSSNARWYIAAAAFAAAGIALSVLLMRRRSDQPSTP
jgi:hypothetical protein